MNKTKYYFLILAVVIVLAGAASYLALRHPSRSALLPLRSADGSIIDLGFTFVPVSAATAEIYNSSGASGSLITAVEKGSLAEEAGLKAGDLVLGLNGVDLNDNKSLLGLIRGCPADSRVTLEVRDSGGVRNVVLCAPSECTRN